MAETGSKSHPREVSRDREGLLKDRGRRLGERRKYCDREGGRRKPEETRYGPSWSLQRHSVMSGGFVSPEAQVPRPEPVVSHCDLVLTFYR